MVDIALQGSGLETPLREGDILRVLPISPHFKAPLRYEAMWPSRAGFLASGYEAERDPPDSQSLITGITGSEKSIGDSRTRVETGSMPTNPDLYPAHPGVITIVPLPGSNNTQITEPGPGAGRIPASQQNFQGPSSTGGRIDRNRVPGGRLQAPMRPGQSAERRAPQIRANMAGQGALSSEMPNPAKGAQSPETAAQHPAPGARDRLVIRGDRASQSPDAHDLPRAV